MNVEEKLLLARRVMLISGVFTLFVALLLILNFIQLSGPEPLESETLEFLVEQLKDDSNNEQLIEEIRSYELMVRKAYFTGVWQVRTGALLLLLGAIVFAVALRFYTDLRKQIEPPEAELEPFVLARKRASLWLAVSGILFIGLAVTAAITSTDYLEAYAQLEPEPMALNSENSTSEIEVVEIQTGNDADNAIVEGAKGNGLNQGSDLNSGELQQDGSTGEFADGDALDGDGHGSGQSSGDQSDSGVSGKVTPAEVTYGYEEFKKQHNTFRGPMAQGVVYHRNIPVKWNGSTGENVIWKVALTKKGYNSPVIWGDRLFLSGGDQQGLIVSCYDRNTGALLWERPVKNIPGSPATMPKTTDDTGLAAPTMAVDGYRAYAIFANGDVVAFDMEGNQVWGRNLGVPQNHYGHSSSLVVWNGKLIIQYDTSRGGRMLALNTLTGETVWDVKRDNMISWASPILIQKDGAVQVATNTDPNVAGHDVETGKELWKVPVMMGEVGPSLAYEDGVVFANNEYASLVAINAEAGASVQWEAYDFLSEAASPVAYNGLLFLATSYGVMACYDTKTGELIWEKDFGVTLYSSPIVAENKVYMMDNTGVMHIIKADRSGELISAPELGEASYAVPAFAEGRIYIRGDKNLYGIGK